MNLQQRIAVIVVDVLVIAELCFSIFLASGDPDNFNIIFFKHFFPMLIPTLVLARVAVKRLRSTCVEETL